MARKRVFVRDYWEVVVHGMDPMIRFPSASEARRSARIFKGKVKHIKRYRWVGK